MISFELLVILLFLSIGIGIICTLGGISEGIFTIAIFILVLGFNPNIAKSTTLFLVLLS